MFEPCNGTFQEFSTCMYVNATHTIHIPIEFQFALMPNVQTTNYEMSIAQVYAHFIASYNTSYAYFIDRRYLQCGKR